MDAIDDNHYLYNNTQYMYSSRTEVINVRSAASVEIIVRDSIIGPVISDIQSTLITIFSNPSQPEVAPMPLSLCTSTLSQADTTLEAILLLQGAEDWPTFRTAMSFFGSPAVEALYADTKGNIGAQFAGNLPVRVAHHNGNPHRLQTSPFYRSYGIYHITYYIYIPRG